MYLGYLLTYCCFVVSLLFALVGVALFTVLERQLLGSIQRRQGVYLVTLGGLLGGLADAIKLLTKELVRPSSSSYLYYLPPLVLLLLSLTPWSLFSLSVYESYGLLLYLLFAALEPYGILLGGYLSKSRYTLLGSYRLLVQVLSYEVFLLLFVACNLIHRQSFDTLSYYLNPSALYLVIPILSVSMLAELSRPPFDLAECESELVSGYNTEYSSSLFVLYFLSEYSSIMLLSTFLTSIVDFPSILLMVFVVVVRAAFPRLRYTDLTCLGWFVLLPLIILYAFLSLYFLT